MRKLTELPLRSLHPELRAAIAEVLGHDRFIFMVLAEEEDGSLTRMSNSDEVDAVLRHLSHT